MCQGGRALAGLLHTLGYEVTRQSGSHIRLTTVSHGEHHVTIPDHDTLRVGTLSAILSEVAKHHGMERDAMIEALFG